MVQKTITGSYLMKKNFTLLGICFLTACGGGGGGSDEVPNFAGVWDATVVLTKDECKLDGTAPTQTDVLTVQQVGSAITVTDSDGGVSQGAVDSGDSFSVSPAPEIV